ncbi:MAG TPA: DNA repair protein RadA [Gaiellales bacterium]|nr:DNA repair protein RadA [Gaiellales bacterium]
MTRTLVAYTCTSCGHRAPKWLGRCPGCGEWNTLEEEAAPAPARNGRARPLAVARLADVETAEGARMATGIDELDRVLGGGLVPGSLVLIGGEPGVGKSSLLLQALAAASARGLRTLLVSGEESPGQVRMRAERLAAAGGIGILAETELEAVAETIAAELPDICVIDSVQTLHSADVASGAGSVVQVREAADRLLRVAKSRGVAIVLVGHVTKDGAVAGPRVLEHLVDAVLQFEGDRYRHLRVLRAVKNRFGSTDEIGIFEMTGTGLVPVADPSSALAEDGSPGPGAVLLPAIEGSRPILLEVQALVAPSDLAMPRRQATGFDRNRLSLILAVLGRHAGIALGSSDVFVNVAGGVRVDEPAADLAVALAIVSSHRGRPPAERLACFGEIGLTGRLRPVGHAAPRLAEAAKLGVTEVVAPDGTAAPAFPTVRRADTLAAAIGLALA